MLFGKLAAGTWKSVFNEPLPEFRLTTAFDQAETSLVMFFDHKLSGSLNAENRVNEIPKADYQYWIFLPVSGTTNSRQDL